MSRYLFAISSGDDTSYMVHPLTLACHALAMGLKNDDVIAACLAHDMLEDTADREQAEDRINPEDLDKPHANILVTRDKKTTNSLFNRKYYDLIMLAAKDPLVERIFVSPAIKVKMCEMTADENMHKYLHKIRPWFGHTEHFHVRLRCPAHAADCEKQTPIPEMNTIAEEKEEALSWFLPPPTDVAKNTQKKPKPELPARCERLAHR